MSKKKMAAASVAVANLFHSERGTIACEKHAPVRGSDSWQGEGWKEMGAVDVAAFEKELGHAIACGSCAVQELREEETLRDGGEPVLGAAQTPDATKKPKRGKTNLTLGELAEKYVDHLERDGHSAGTAASYGLEMRTACGELGAETPIADLTTQKIRAYFDSAKVTKKRSGKPKSPLSIAKTRRVLRLSLAWAATKGWFDAKVIPSDETK